jgi:hypothetical protein
MSIAAVVERSPDIKMLDTVDEDQRPTRVGGSFIATWALPSMRDALRSEAQHPVPCHRIAIGWHLRT